jgi:hypothetical protein
MAVTLNKSVPPFKHKTSLRIIFSCAVSLSFGLNAVDLSGTKPSPEGEGWVTTARMQEVEQRREQLPRGNQNNDNNEESLFISPHPNLLPEGEGACTLKSTALSLGLKSNSEGCLPRHRINACQSNLQVADSSIRSPREENRRCL